MGQRASDKRIGDEDVDNAKILKRFKETTELELENDCQNVADTNIENGVDSEDAWMEEDEDDINIIELEHTASEDDEDDEANQDVFTSLDHIQQAGKSKIPKAITKREHWAICGQGLGALPKGTLKDKALASWKCIEPPLYKPPDEKRPHPETPEEVQVLLTGNEFSSVTVQPDANAENERPWKQGVPVGRLPRSLGRVCDPMSRARLRYGVTSGRGAAPLNTFELRKEALKGHLSHKYRRPTHFISFSKDPEYMFGHVVPFSFRRMKREGYERTKSSTQFILLNVNARIAEEWPILSAEDEMAHYMSPEDNPYRHSASEEFIGKIEYLMPWRVTYSQIVAVWVVADIEQWILENDPEAENFVFQKRGKRVKACHEYDSMMQGWHKWFRAIAEPALQAHEEAKLAGRPPPKVKGSVDVLLTIEEMAERQKKADSTDNNDTPVINAT